jgi:predicted nucleotidyltransferase
MSASGTLTFSDLQAQRERILAVAARHGASDVRVFGSIARGEGGPDSDVDVLVTLDPGRTLLDLGGLQFELESLLGRRVDVVTDGGISGELAMHVRREARQL